MEQRGIEFILFVLALWWLLGPWAILVVTVANVAALRPNPFVAPAAAPAA
jgi:hypothetical protein